MGVCKGGTPYRKKGNNKGRRPAVSSRSEYVFLFFLLSLIWVQEVYQASLRKINASAKKSVCSVVPEQIGPTVLNMKNTDLQAHADALAERAKHLAKRARDAKRRAIEAEEYKARICYKEVGVAVLSYLSGQTEAQQSEFLTRIGISELSQRYIFPYIPDKDQDLSETESEETE